MNINSTEYVTCVLASGNQGKLAELQGALSAHGIELVSQAEYAVSEADETGATFIENALIKARHASQVTGLAALADDSGLVVPALHGQPGIRSARYAESSAGKPTDQDNINKLLNELSSQPQASRDAYFVCVLALLRHANDPEPLIATGRWHGSITEGAQGEGGFGYDPVFYCPTLAMTAAAMGKDKKQQVSHRAIAIEALKRTLQHSEI